MKIFDWLKKRRRKEELQEEEAVGGESFGERTLDRDDVDINDPVSREKYVETCLEQIAEASKEMEILEEEYRDVNEHLKDVEEIEFLAGDDKELLLEHARGVARLSRDSGNLKEKERRLKDSDFKKMRRMEADVENGIRKLQEAESYQDAIRQDLKRLEGEKQACIYRQGEARLALNNFRGMAVILICAIFACVLLLMFLQFGLDMDTKVGYVLLMLAAGISLLILYMKYGETSEELKRATSSQNRIVLLQNKVKIRYVNNTNLLDYYYLKYDTPSADSLKKLWEQYQEEKDERIRMEQVLADLDYHREELVKLLKRYRLKDPLIWTCQAEAILDSREMVEVRHRLITRRQSLRKRMEYNRELAENAQKEIKELVQLYPAYGLEIMKQIEKFEKRRDEK